MDFIQRSRWRADSEHVPVFPFLVLVHGSAAGPRARVLVFRRHDIAYILNELIQGFRVLVISDGQVVVKLLPVAGRAVR